jgi:hypothetical protein
MIASYWKIPSIVGSLGRRVGLLAALLLIVGPTSGSSQTCPAYIAPDIPLQNTSTSSPSCTTVEGRTICQLWCTYLKRRDEGRIDTADLKLKWVSEMLRPNAPVLEDSCGPGTRITNGQRHSNRQVTARYAGSNVNIEKYLAIEANLLMVNIANSSAECPQVTINNPTGERMPPPSSPYCRGGRPQGRLKAPTGKVDIYSYGFDKWKGPITSEFPLMACDYVRTGPGSSAVVFLYTPSGAEDRINMMSDTILEVPGPPENAALGSSDGFFTTLMKGTIKWFSGETAGERRRREQEERESRMFNVRTPTIVTARRGTEFVLRHDDILKKDYIFVNSGSVEVSAGGVKKLLTSGQQMFAERSKLSAVYSMPANIWTVASELRRNTAWEQLFSGAAIVSTDVGPDSEKAGSKGSDVGTIGGFTGPIFYIAYLGRNYRTVYERSTHENIPIDLYYFEIFGTDGRPASQDGTKLWGRFVRQPASDQEAKSGVNYWFVEWIFRSGRWERIDTKVGGFTPTREIQK